MRTLDDTELCIVTGGATPSSLGKIPGTRIYAVPPKDAVCNREQFDWMAARVGRGVQPHVVAADSRLCGFPMPGTGGETAAPAGPSNTAAGKFLNTPGTDLDFFRFLR